MYRKSVALKNMLPLKKQKNLLPMKFYTLCGVAALAAAFAGCQNTMTIKTKPYPVARMDTTVQDDYHGTIVKDPYRWLEDDNSAETAAWVKAENEVTQDYLSQIPYRDRIKERLTQLYDYPKEGTPFRVGEYYFFYKNDGLQNQSVLYYQKGLDGTPEVFLDPNTLSENGTVALNTVTFSKDDRYAAYSVSKSGSDWVEIFVMEVATRKQLADKIEWVKFSGASWGKDGFYYSRYDAPAPGAGFKTLFPGFANDYAIVDCRDDRALVLTNDEAPNFRLVSVDLRAAVPAVEDVIPQSENLLQWVTTAGGSLMAGYLKDASSRVCQYDRSGKLVREITLPGIGTVSGFDGEQDDTEVFYGFSSFNVPPTSYRYSLADGTSTLYRQTKVNFDVSAFEVEQVFYTSKDGTRVPMFLVYKKGLKRDGNNPVYLYAYGGFNISGILALEHPAARTGRDLRTGQHPGRRRVWRGLAPCRDARKETECL